MKRFGTGISGAIFDWNKGVQSSSAFFGLKVLSAIIGVIGSLFFVIIDLVVEFIFWVGSWFNGVSDDQAREFVNSKNCEQINQLNDIIIKDLINLMLDGSCGDDDERAILKLLSCLNCQRRGNVVHLVGLDRLNYKIDGSEYDEFQILLGMCDLVSFDRWSGDISQQFINHNPSTLNNLSAKSLSDLLWNLIEGYTPDIQENAIFTLLRNIDCAKLKQIFTMYGNMRQAIYDETSPDSGNRHEYDTILKKCNL